LALAAGGSGLLHWAQLLATPGLRLHHRFTQIPHLGLKPFLAVWGAGKKNWKFFEVLAD